MGSRKRNDLSTSRTLLVTPLDARKMLESNSKNRNIRPVHVKRLASMMERGQWRAENPHGSTIMLDEDGILMDGQHRLEAVVLSNSPQWFQVYEGVPREIMPILDSEQASRSLKDSLKILLGEATPVNVDKMVHITAMLLRWEPGSRTEPGSLRANATVADQSEFLLENEEGLSAAAHVVRRCATSPLRLVVSASGALYFTLVESGVPTSQVDEFFDQITTGAMLPANCPTMKLRALLTSRVEESVGRTTYVRNHEMLCALVETWNNWAAGTPGSKKLRFHRNDASLPGLVTDHISERWFRKGA